MSELLISLVFENAEMLCRRALRIFEGKKPSLILVVLAASFFLNVLPLAAQPGAPSETGCCLLERQDTGAVEGSTSNDQNSMKSFQQTEAHGKLVAKEKNNETAELKKNRPIEPWTGDQFQQALWCKPWPICETPEEQNFVR